MNIAGRTKQGFYFDSVTLMRVGKELSAVPGVIEASVVMATDANKSILDMSGLLLDEFKKCGDQDLCVAVKAKDQTALDAAFAKADELLSKKKKPAAAGAAAAPSPRDIPGAVAQLEGANMAIISVAGRYAAREARKALEAGLNVMLFSDNVSLEDELELKKEAHKKGLIVMGPDCGTSIINGVPLCFANVVPQGPIGVVGASGTGTQEVTCVVANAGSGISQAIGTGGRDVKDSIGGISFLDALDALAADDATKVILLVSKPPQPGVMKKIDARIKKIKKPVVKVLLGSGEAPKTLEHAALMAVAYAKGEDPAAVGPAQELRNAELAALAQKIVSRKKAPQGRYLRGLFSGGSFVAEAQVILAPILRTLYSNAPLGDSKPMKNDWKPERNCIIDLGEDEFTRGRAHPMIDFTLRNKMIQEVADDPETAVILLDLVLGYGSNLDPAAEWVPILKTVTKKVPVVIGITGTDADPQPRLAIAEALRKAGALVEFTNGTACRLAGHLTAEIVKSKR